MEKVNVVDDANVKHIGDKTEKSRQSPSFRIEECWNQQHRYN